MSMLLDALRKSEKRQKSRAAPDIHAAGHPEPRAGFPRALWLALAVAGLTVVVAGAWYLWPLGVEPTPESAAAPGGGTVEEPQAAAAGKQGGATARRQAKPVSPVETLDATGQDQAGAAKKQLSEAERKAEREARRKAERQAKRQAARQAQRQAAASEAPAAPPPSVPQSPPAATGGSKAGQARAAGAAGEPEAISYWELPSSVRQQLPEMNISVLVFAEQPAERFVLMDGQRLSEGDQLQDGLTLQEVRRDGAVMRFRMYRFLVSHD